MDQDSITTTTTTTTTSSFKAHVGPIHALKFNSTGDYFFSAGADKIIRLWNTQETRLVQSYLAHGWEIADLAISNDSTRFASCGGDKAVFLWDIHQSQPIKRFHGHQHRINAVAMNEDGSVVASGSYDATVRLWDCKSNDKTPIQTLSDAKDSITSIVIKEHLILTASVDAHLRTYDLRLGTKSMDEFPAPITFISMTSDMQCVFVSSLDSTIRILDAQNGTLLNTFQGHINTQYKLTHSLDFTEGYLISGSEDHLLSIWDITVPSPQIPTKTLSGHLSTIMAVAAHPKQSLLLSASVEGMVRTWSGFSSEC